MRRCRRCWARDFAAGCCPRADGPIPRGCFSRRAWSAAQPFRHRLPAARQRERRARQCAHVYVAAERLRNGTLSPSHRGGTGTGGHPSENPRRHGTAVAPPDGRRRRRRRRGRPRRRPRRNHSLRDCCHGSPAGGNGSASRIRRDRLPSREAHLPALHPLRPGGHALSRRRRRRRAHPSDDPSLPGAPMRETVRDRIRQLGGVRR